MDDEYHPYDSDSGVILSGLGPQRCEVCASTSRLLHCSSCKVVSYCSNVHQSAHRSKHKEVCIAIKKYREALEDEEAALRVYSIVFITSVGNFWAIHSTRGYMKARYTAANEILRVNTVRAVEKALGHFADMLRLCRSDSLCVRDLIPGLLLRLSREQECYDFLKWWAISSDEEHYNERHDWVDTTLPYLNIHEADAFEPIDVFHSNKPSLSHLATLTLLKLRLHLDLHLVRTEEDELGIGYDDSFVELDRPLGAIVRAKLSTHDMLDVSESIDELERQCHRLCQEVTDANPYFWDAWWKMQRKYLPRHCRAFPVLKTKRI